MSKLKSRSEALKSAQAMDAKVAIVKKVLTALGNPLSGGLAQSPGGNFSYCGMSQRSFAEAQGISRAQLRRMISIALQSGLSFNDIVRLPDGKLYEMFKKNSSPAHLVEPDWEKIHAVLNPASGGKVPSIEFVWSEHYLKQYWPNEMNNRELPEGCMSQRTFTRHYEAWCLVNNRASYLGRVEATPTIYYPPGHMMMIDFDGDKHYYRTKDGTLHAVKLFGAVLPHSGMVFAMAFTSSGTADWWIGIRESFSRFGGAVPYVRSDNDVGLVNYKRKGESGSNTHPKAEIATLLDEYHSMLDLAPVRSPRSKANVERFMGLINQGFLSGGEFCKVIDAGSIEEYNEKLLELCDKFNSKAISGMKVSRRYVFESSERQHLLPLPAEKPSMRDVKTVSVSCKGEIRVGRDWFFVPEETPGQYHGGSVIREIIDNRELKILDPDTRKVITSYDKISWSRTAKAMHRCHESDMNEAAKAVRFNKRRYVDLINNMADEFNPDICHTFMRVIDAVWGVDEENNPIATKQSNLLMAIINRNMLHIDALARLCDIYLDFYSGSRPLDLLAIEREIPNQLIMSSPVKKNSNGNAIEDFNAELSCEEVYSRGSDSYE